MAYTKRTRRRANQVWGYLRRNPGSTRYDIHTGLEAESGARWIVTTDHVVPPLKCLEKDGRIRIEKKGNHGRFRYYVTNKTGLTPDVRTRTNVVVVDEIAVPMDETLSTTDEAWDIFAKINENNDLVIRVKAKESSVLAEQSQLANEVTTRYFALVDTITAFINGEITMNQLKEAIE